MESWEIHVERTKGQGRTCAPKAGTIDQGHPQTVSGIGENRTIPLSGRHAASGGERKLPLIVH